MEPYHINSAIAALGYAIAAICSKRALGHGAGVLRVSFIMNWAFVPVFGCLLFSNVSEVPYSLLQYPVLAGGLFFLGQLFTFAAIRFGDVSLQTPVMGTKAVFVVIIAVLLGTEVVSLPMATAAVVAMLGVALLCFSGDGAERVGRTLGLALLSSFFFACSDTMVGYHAGAFGVPMFLFLAILTNALLSLALIPFFRDPLQQMPAPAWPWITLACLIMAGQALLLNYSLGRYQNVAAINVIYSTRGLWSVVLGAISLRLMVSSRFPSVPRRILYLRMAGALLMCLAIVILFYPF
tara:strand:- start:50331 stop:51212 length:882 start_codon:yes stop_codon:yes gene_type:complete